MVEVIGQFNFCERSKPQTGEGRDAGHAERVTRQIGTVSGHFVQIRQVIQRGFLLLFALFRALRIKSASIHHNVRHKQDLCAAMVDRYVARGTEFPDPAGARALGMDDSAILSDAVALVTNQIAPKKAPARRRG